MPRRRKIKPEQIPEIRLRIAIGKANSIKAIAADYGVSVQTLSQYAKHGQPGGSPWRERKIREYIRDQSVKQ
jgi:DNA invertase Pin-like site-specific DNA recombinase